MRETDVLLNGLTRACRIVEENGPPQQRERSSSDLDDRSANTDDE